MSEEDRTHVYAWLCEEIGKRRADYVMSRLAPAPLSDLVTKDFLAAQFALHRTEIATQFAAERARADAQREADRKEIATQFAAERARADAQREADRAEAKQRFRWTIGTLIASNGLLVGAAGTVVGLA